MLATLERGRPALPLAISGNNFVVNCVTGCRPRVFSVAIRSVSSRLALLLPCPLVRPQSAFLPARTRGHPRPAAIDADGSFVLLHALQRQLQWHCSPPVAELHASINLIQQ